MWFKIFLFVVINQTASALKPNPNFLDLCGINNGKRLYVELGVSGTLSAQFRNCKSTENDFESVSNTKKCSVEFVTCPSCIIHIQFSYLNISRSCGKSSLFDTCGCNYVLLSEPSFRESSGEQFCGRFRRNNVTHLDYISRTRSVAIEFLFNGDFGQAFSLEFSSIRNRVQLDGYPRSGQLNHSNQTMSSPFFPNLYPTDLSMEYFISCHSVEFCRVSLVFTDFLLAESSIIEFFDWNGTRMNVASGSVFRPPVIVSSGPNLTIRFYANGASGFGFKATYSFILGHLEDTILRPNIDCGGHVFNLGGGITMMDMIKQGVRFFDCLWIIKPPSNYMQRKTNLYVKVFNFSDFGTTELVVRQGLTSNEPIIEAVKYPLPHFNAAKQKEHVVPISEGFYISLRGYFKPESQVSIVYAAFNYKDCYSGLDFLCNNLRCISMLLNCDGFDHCGDSSDESTECSKDPRDHRRFSQIPNFLFPKNTESYSDITTTTFAFLTCTFGLVGIILTMALLLYRVNTRARHQRRMHDHLETIHAILEEGVVEVEEEAITPDDPPDYEAPPEYTDVLKYLRKVTSCGRSTQTKPTPNNGKQSTTNLAQNESNLSMKSMDSGTSNSSQIGHTNRSCQTTPSRAIPESPPPAYENILRNDLNTRNLGIEENEDLAVELPCSSRSVQNLVSRDENTVNPTESIENIYGCFSSKILSWKRIKNLNIEKDNDKQFKKKRFSSEENLLARHYSESEVGLRQNSNDIFWKRCGNIKKSFSTADLFFYTSVQLK